MALDRQSIARRDFPTNRRGGYDPEAVDAHLDAVAAEVAELQRRAASAAPLSEQASAQVQAIVEAAERGARDIRAAAEADARQRVAHVTEAADRLRARLDQLEADVTGLLGGLREGAARLHGELAAAEALADELRAPASAPAPEPAAPEPQPAPPEPPPAAPAPAAAGDDAAAARIVALDMALSGTPRAETDRYLAEHYAVADRDALLDEVYAAAGT
ncbi:MAG: hypothetical protein QOG35_1767 [Solirubrobacteraceae bacterium]|nr:hypothetical protein [Solirubrobacteraceae bacterium]